MVEDGEDGGEDGGEDDGEDESAAAAEDDLETRQLHASLITKARAQFPTRAALEDALASRQREVNAAVDRGFDVDRETLMRAAQAEDEVRRLLPLRLILPTAEDLAEMIGVLREHEEGHERNGDAEKACIVRSEIEELQEQIEKEERHLK